MSDEDIDYSDIPPLTDEQILSMKPLRELFPELTIQKKLLSVPIFQSEDEEREFWATADSTEYIDWAKAKEVVFPNLKRSSK